MGNQLNCVGDAQENGYCTSSCGSWVCGDTGAPNPGDQAPSGQGAGPAVGFKIDIQLFSRAAANTNPGTRYRTCTTVPATGGSSNNTESENGDYCISASWSIWSCVNGDNGNRYRTCTTGYNAAGSVINCSGSSSQSGNYCIQPSWDDWYCQNPDDGYRSRNCNQGRTNLGVLINCMGSNTENGDYCRLPAWNDWGSWGICNQSGQQTRTRTCARGRDHLGAFIMCSGINSETRNCTPPPPPSSGPGGCLGLDSSCTHASECCGGLLCSDLGNGKICVDAEDTMVGPCGFCNSTAQCPQNHSCQGPSTEKKCWPNNGPPCTQ
jgi:hypothetical protein